MTTSTSTALAHRPWKAVLPCDPTTFQGGVETDPLPGEKQNGGRSLSFVYGTPPPRKTNNDKKAAAGFYSQDTKEAYEILLQSFKAKAIIRQEELNTHDNDGYACFTSFTSCMPSYKMSTTGDERARFVERLEYAQDLVAFVQARLESNGPDAPLSASDISKHGGRPETFFGDGTATTNVMRDYYLSFVNLQALRCTKQVKLAPLDKRRGWNSPMFGSSIVLAGGCGC